MNKIIFFFLISVKIMQSWNYYLSGNLRCRNKDGWWSLLDWRKEDPYLLYQRQLDREKLKLIEETKQRKNLKNVPKTQLHTQFLLLFFIYRPLPNKQRQSLDKSKRHELSMTERKRMEGEGEMCQNLSLNPKTKDFKSNKQNKYFFI